MENDKPTYYELVNRNQELEIENERLKSQISFPCQDELNQKITELPFEKIFRKHDAVMFLIHGETGTFVDVNLAAEKFYGYSLAQFIKLKIGDINKLPPDELDAERERALEEKRLYFIVIGN